MSRQRVNPGTTTPTQSQDRDRPPLPHKDGDVLTTEGIKSPGDPQYPTPGVGRRTIKICWGEETYHPVQFNGFKCGGIELVVDVAPNQTIEDAYELGYQRLEALAKKQFERKLDGFIERLKIAGQKVKISAATKAG